jgi:23S rRNA (cytosine1962-C5)-methyltransferase
LQFLELCTIIVPMDVVYLSRTSRVLTGHLWVFSNELATSLKECEPGSIVELRDKRERFFGIGYINPHSLIAVRILTRESEEINRGFIKRRILDALEYRRRFCGETDSFRVVNSEGDYIPGLIVDRYGSCLSLQFLTMGMERMSESVIEALDEIFSPSTIVLRNDNAVRLLEGLRLEKKVIKGSLDTLPVIREGSLLFEVDPLRGQKTGFFLDQRENRSAFTALVTGGEGLDLFCYTGAWGIPLAEAGAYVRGIDDSDHAIAQAERNAAMNNLSERCSFEKANALNFLEREGDEGSRYDFIVLDPPAFVKSKLKVKEGMKGYREINSRAIGLLKKGGLLATSSCSYHIDRVMFIDIVKAAARDAGKQARLIEVRSQAKDHPVLLSMPETGYLTCVFLEVR